MPALIAATVSFGGHAGVLHLLSRVSGRGRTGFLTDME